MASLLDIYNTAGDVAGFVTDSLMLPIRKGGELLQAGYEGAKANIAEHPIYGNLGPQGLAEELTKPPAPTPTFDERKATYEAKKEEKAARAEKNSPEAMAERAKPHNLFQYLTPETVAAAKAPNEGESQTETQARNAIIDSTVQDPEKNPNTAALIAENPNASVDEIAKAKSTDSYEAGKKTLLQNNATKEDLSAWDKFNQEYDLTTIGLALMASNDGSRNLSQNLAYAMQAGRQYKQDQKDKMTAQEQAAAEAARKERETQVKEENAVSSRISATSGAAADLAKIENMPFENKIAQIKADAAMLRAQRTGMNDTSKVQLNRDMSEIQNYLQGADLMKDYGDLSQSEREAIAEVGAYELAEVRKRSGGRLTPQQEIKLATELALQRGGRTKEAGMFGFGKERY